MALPSFDDLFREADAHARRLPAAVAGAADGTVLEAMRAAHDRGWVVPLLAGREDDIHRVAADRGVSLEGFTIVGTEEPAARAVAEVRSGRARLLIKGQIATPALMRAVLDPEAGLRTSRVICQVVLMEIERDRRRFLMADTGISIQPSLDQKADIVRSAAEVARALGVEVPRVAIMAASETVSDAMPETGEAAEIERRFKGARGCMVQGPLSFDLAYEADAADKKGTLGPVVGAADVMVFPNLVSANLTVKAIMYTAGCRFGGVLCGAACPVVFMSRADTTQTRLRSLALTLGIMSSAS